MASRKEQKEQARARRLAEEQARAARARRDRRLRMVGGSVLIALALVAIAIAVSSGNSGPSGLKKGTQAKATEQLVDSELAGIPQSGATLGNPKAPVTMIYYGDLECPVCAAFTNGAEGGGLPQLIANEVKRGKVKIDYRPFCTATCNGAGPGQSVFNTQQVAALAAGLQNKFWNYTELFYHEQGAEGSGYVNSSFLSGLASQVPGLNTTTWQSNQSNSQLLSQVQQGESQAAAASVGGTPTVFMVGPKGQKLVNSATGVPTYSELTSTIAQVE